MGSEEKERSFEEKLQAVQEIIARIEEGRLPLEESVEAFQRGMKTLAGLDAELKEMNRKLTVLRDGADGTPEEAALEEEG